MPRRLVEPDQNNLTLLSYWRAGEATNPIAEVTPPGTTIPLHAYDIVRPLYHGRGRTHDEDATFGYVRGQLGYMLRPDLQRMPTQAFARAFEDSIPSPLRIPSQSQTHVKEYLTFKAGDLIAMFEDSSEMRIRHFGGDCRRPLGILRGRCGYIVDEDLGKLACSWIDLRFELDADAWRWQTVV